MACKMSQVRILLAPFFRSRQGLIYACAMTELCCLYFVESISAGGVAKRPKATVCKTVIRGFESHRRLFFST